MHILHLSDMRSQTRLSGRAYWVLRYLMVGAEEIWEGKFMPQEGRMTASSQNMNLG
jgi:hypothetical protein